MAHHYPGMSFPDRLCDVSVTSWYLKSTNPTISGKIFSNQKLTRGKTFGIDITYKNSRSIIFVDLEAIAKLCDDFCMFVTFTHEMFIFFH